MAHNVICPICGKRFDRDKIPFVQVNSRRYAHADCAIQRAENLGEPAPEVINPEVVVLCKLCKKPIDKNSSECGALDNGQYAHLSCIEAAAAQELTEEEKLDNYVMNLFKTEYVPPGVRKQIKDFQEKYNFTISGIRKSLIYWYEIKKNTTEKAKGGIGIVPYIYQDAYRYFYMIWEARQKNIDKNIEAYKPKEVIIHIPMPKPVFKKKKLFTFLDEEEEVSEN